MKRLLTLTLAVCLAAGAAYAEVRGSWTADAEKAGTLHVSMSQRRGWMNGHTFTLAELPGLTSAQIQSASQTPVQFQLRRDAGVIAFDGVFKTGNGAGQFNFTPNANYAGELRKLGLELELDHRGKRSDEDELFTLAIVDLSPAYIRAMRAEGFDVSLEDYIGMRAVGVTTAYVRELRAMGLKALDADDVTGLRAVGVTREYAELVRAIFPNTPIDDLQGMKAVGVTPAWIQSMRSAGVTIDSAETATGLKAVGVTPEYIREMRAIFPKLDGDEVQGMKAVGVTPEYVREMRDAGVRIGDSDDVTSMKAVGVTAKFVQQLAAAGYKNLSAEKLTELKAVGVDEKFIRDMSKYQN
jgi:hypothetical protein